MNYTNILVTGGAGFIGCNLVRRWLTQYPELRIHVVDKLTYAGNLASLRDVKENPDLGTRMMFHQNDICNWAELVSIFKSFTPQAVIHLAAESHVDRSIDDASPFIKTNVIGTESLLCVALQHYKRTMPNVGGATPFRFVHVSTDEVYGSNDMVNGHWGDPFEETQPLNPTSPYAASKAASDLLALSYFKTFQLPVIVTRCVNNFGPYQYPEKFIPTCILNALTGKDIPLYGDGEQVRDWIHVEDHCDALSVVLNRGEPGEIYNIGADCSFRNKYIAQFVCSNLNQPTSLIKYVQDRPAHDRRYAIEFGKIERLGMAPLRAYDKRSFDASLEQTITWYAKNQAWVKEVLDGKYNMERQGVIK